MGKRRGLLCLLLVSVVLGTAAVASAFQPVYVMASGNMGGTYYSLGGILAETVNEKLPGVRVAVLPSGGSAENVDLMEKGLAQFALIDSFAVMAYQGRDLYYEAPQTYLRGVVPLYPEVARILVPKDSAIVTLSDLAGKKVVLGKKGSGVLITAQQILMASGLRQDQLEPAYLGMGEGLLALREGSVDAVIFVGPLGGGSAMEQEALKDARIIGLDDKTRKKLMDTAPYWKEFVVPAGTFDGQIEDIKTVGAWTVLCCREDLDDDLINRVAETVYDNAEDISSYIPGSVKLSPDNVDEVLIPLHDGAKKFFDGKGAL
ncbi:TAXI family TRAP transporter solute-binding subunit [Dethiosulfovibrio sp. F2B]|uniref:TAXI family TRAP transporter solute-binding subunit n=1 Tax=Dethiosulfovibrio faecalis TaxID=2720018 RepID=UPI001F333C72|nr:TAXI family TRAP transporter solute-binding subunit [Dethiosulfovibrio faecalis]